MFNFMRRKDNSSRSVAKERLQIILAHERGHSRRADLISPAKLDTIKAEIIEVLERNLGVGGDKLQFNVDVKQDRQDRSVLEVEIEMADGASAS